MSWKQPIPTDLDEMFGTDYLARDLYIQLLLKSANKDGWWTDDKTKRTFMIKRGQVVFGQNKWGRSLRTSPKSVSRALTKLSEKYKKVTYSISQKFSLVTIIDYDDVCRMADSRLTGDLLMTTSKSVKSDKSERLITPPPKKEISQNQKDILKVWSNSLGGRYLGSVELDRNIAYWLTEDRFTLPDVLQAIKNIPRLVEQETRGDFWHNMTPQLFFRQRNSSGEADYITRALNANRNINNLRMIKL